VNKSGRLIVRKEETERQECYKNKDKYRDEYFLGSTAVLRYKTGSQEVTQNFYFYVI
jgi:hypothetical protein